jgi:thioredoxin reductase (NADPH)
MNAARDGAAYTGKNIYVVGGADGAVKEALYLASFARHLTIIHFEDQLGCIAEFRQKVAAAGTSLCGWPPGSAPSWGGPVERLEIAESTTAPLRPWRIRAAASSSTPV